MRAIIYLFVAIAVVALGIRISGRLANAAPQLSKPTWNGDDHDNPVYISPTNQSTITHWAPTNALPAVPPALTNWPVTNLPPTTNWPATNSPSMTNPPVLPPGDP